MSYFSPQPATSDATVFRRWLDKFTQGFEQGTYTPTLTNSANLDASTAYECTYYRVGDAVTVSGKADVDPTAAGSTTTTLGISLPIASAFANTQECAGVGATVAGGTVAGISGDTTNDRAQLQFLSSFTNNVPIYFQFTYRIV